jgi:hypothetical protein
MRTQPVVFDFAKGPPTREQIQAFASETSRITRIVTAVCMAGLTVLDCGLLHLTSRAIGDWTFVLLLAANVFVGFAGFYGLCSLADSEVEWLSLEANFGELSLEQMARLPGPEGLPENVKLYMRAIAAQGRHPVQAEADMYCDACRNVQASNSPFVSGNGFVA